MWGFHSCFGLGHAVAVVPDEFPLRKHGFVLEACAAGVQQFPYPVPHGFRVPTHPAPWYTSCWNCSASTDRFPPFSLRCVVSVQPLFSGPPYVDVFVGLCNSCSTPFRVPPSKGSQLISLLVCFSGSWTYLLPQLAGKRPAYRELGEL